MFKQEEKDRDTQNIIAAVQQGKGDAFVQKFLNDREAFMVDLVRLESLQIKF